MKTGSLTSDIITGGPEAVESMKQLMKVGVELPSMVTAVVEFWVSRVLVTVWPALVKVSAPSE